MIKRRNISQAEAAHDAPAARQRHLARCWEAADSVPTAIKLRRAEGRGRELAAESGCPRVGNRIICKQTGEPRAGHCTWCGR